MRDAVIDDVEALRAAVEGGARFSYVCFWSHNGDAARVDRDCLSQWAPVGFTVDGQRYATAEHWMMAEKARLFGDAEHRAAILAAAHPKQVKALGRQVRGFDQATWLAHRDGIVQAGNRHKFTQNPAERAWLLGTGDQILVEASPVDLVWGVGWAPDRPEARDPHRWRGLNRLGFALMRVRAELS
ncbi:MAG: NADAR family protein [Myxococcales bacterium]|nr:NADAR family protein [Myxococcales bacterium]MCB9523479.1 NADAR family protein [Myxococcales bacterium]